MRVLPALCVLALIALPTLDDADAKSAIVIVVENNQGEKNALQPNQQVIDTLAGPTERLLQTLFEREIDRALADLEKAPKKPARKPKARKPKARKPRTRRGPRAKRNNQLPSWARKWMDQNGKRILNEVIEPWIDRYGEAFYAKLLELAAARKWDEVVVLSDEQATFETFADTLRDLDRRGFKIDVLINVHGSPKNLKFTGNPATQNQVAALGANGKLNLNTVYAVACWGSHFNQAWMKAGARSANGSRALNYYVLISPLTFLYAYSRGMDLEQASKVAYRVEKRFLDRPILNEMLAPIYGRGRPTVNTARSSLRVQTGPRIRAAWAEEKVTPARPFWY